MTRRLSDEDRTNIVQVYQRFKNIGRTANFLGFGYTTVRAVLQEAGVEYGVPVEQQMYRRRVHAPKVGQA